MIGSNATSMENLSMPILIKARKSCIEDPVSLQFLAHRQSSTHHQISPEQHVQKFVCHLKCTRIVEQKKFKPKI